MQALFISLVVFQSQFLLEFSILKELRLCLCPWVNVFSAFSAAKNT